MEYKDLLLEYFLDWQKREGKLKNQREFADHIGIHKMVLNHLFNGTRGPSKETAEKLYIATGDARFCEFAGYDVPDYVLKLVRERWPHLTQEKKDQVAEIIGIYERRKAPRKNPATPNG